MMTLPLEGAFLTRTRPATECLALPGSQLNDTAVPAAFAGPRFAGSSKSRLCRPELNTSRLCNRSGACICGVCRTTCSSRSAGNWL